MVAGPGSAGGRSHTTVKGRYLCFVVSMTHDVSVITDIDTDAISMRYRFKKTRRTAIARDSGIIIHGAMAD